MGGCESGLQVTWSTTPAQRRPYGLAVNAMTDAGDMEASSEARVASRRRVLKAGIVASNDRHLTVACTVRDMSASGARLRVAGSVGIPDTFELMIEVDGLEADCEVSWRRGDE